MATELRTSIVLATTHTKAELVELLIAQTEAAAAAQAQADEALERIRDQAGAPGLDVERLLDAANRVGEDSGDLIHWDVDQQWWELPKGPQAFIRAVAAAYAEADREAGE